MALTRPPAVRLDTAPVHALASPGTTLDGIPRTNSRKAYSA
ncbi:hypothetical protein [Streptomyces sp. NPDC002580]